MLSKFFNRTTIKRRRRQIIEEIEAMGYRVTDSLGREIEHQNAGICAYFVWAPDGSAVNPNGGYGRLRDAYQAVVDHARTARQSPANSSLIGKPL